MKQTNAKDSAPIAFTRLGEVKINDAYVVNAMNKEIGYLLSLDADKLLYFFYVNAELTPKTDFSYGVKNRGGLQQWEGGLIGGHIMGHYLSALAQAYANANTAQEEKREILERIRYLTAELKSCQDNAAAAGSKAGFLWGASLTATGKTDNYEYQFDFVERTGNGFTTDAWVPWYTMHKIIAGLYDCATLAGDATAKEVVLALGDWVYDRVSKWDRVTQLRTLKAEYGGMNACMYDLFALTGEEKYAAAANKFDEEALFGKVLDAPKNYLDGLHANTTIPKILGALNRYVTCNGRTVGGETVDAEVYLEVAETFWQYVIDRHTYLTGGNSEWEHFGKDDVLNGERTNANCETCNTYNMLKLSRTLFTVTGKKKYLDYYENTYYNAILSSQNPDTGMTTYFQPMATGYFKVYSSEENHFWCCTGSGMESFTKLGDSVYYAAGNATYVSMYLASEYQTDGVSLTMNADLENSDTAEITVDAGKTILRLHRPYWSDTFGVTVNKNAVTVGEGAGFVSVEVKKGDVIKVNLEKRVKAYNLPDGENVYGFLYGPYVLSAELGTENMTTGTTGVSVTVPSDKIGDRTIVVNADSVAAFTEGIDRAMTKGADNKFTLVHNGGMLTYSYHFRQHTQRYGIYFEFTAEEVKEEIPETVWARQDTVQPGYGQYENDALHAMRETNTVNEQNVAGLGTYRKANAGGSFAYRMKVDKNTQNRLGLTFAKADNGKSILVKSGNTQLYSATLNYTGAQETYSVYVNFPAAVTASAQTVTYDDGSGNRSATVIPVTFSGVGGAESARLCGYIYSEAYRK